MSTQGQYPYPQALLAIGGARTGIAPANLLDVQLLNGENHYWADRKLVAPSALDGSSQSYLPWVVSIPEIKFHRSMTTDAGIFVIQNLSGDSLNRDFETIVTRSSLEGAFFIYRCWQADAMASWKEFHGTLSVQDIGTEEAQLKGTQTINYSDATTPQAVLSETCQLDWASSRCGSTEPTECSYSAQSCQVIERLVTLTNNFEKNYGEADANIATLTMNRQRRI